MAGRWQTAVRMGCALAAAAALGPVRAADATSIRVGPRVDGYDARASRPLAGTARLHVTVTLEPRDPARLAAYAQSVSTPGSSDYRHYLTPAQFARRFGAAPARVTAVRDSLRAHGLSPGRASAGSLSIPILASAAELDRAFSISLRGRSLPGRRTAVTAGAAPAFDARVAGAVQSVVGLDTTALHPLVQRLASGAGTRSVPRAVTGGPQACPQAHADAPQDSAYTADQIASAYGFSGLYGAGDQGAGVTIAIYELEPNDPADIAAYQACYGTHTSVSYVPVDGGVGSGSGSDEAVLDIENVVGLAPRANVVVYQGANAGSGPYDTFSTIVNRDLARVVSVSWGDCEAAVGHAMAISENTLFEQAAVQGQSIVAAAGDNGSEDCAGSGTGAQAQPAVDDPASQPHVTGVGGTSLLALGPRPLESVWNDSGGLAGGLLAAGAGGGGVSGIWSMPAAQRDAAGGLGVRATAGSSSVCGNPAGYCREVPDVAIDADPSSGYLIYWNGSGAVAGQPSGWQGIGGTSAGTPVWAALLALVDASRACAGAPVGDANPALYGAASSAYDGNFNDVTTGNNDFTKTNGGRFAAGRGYDLATGLGTPNAAALAAGLCADTISIGDPGPQRSTARASVSLRLHASDALGRALDYTAAGLPPGLELDAASGQITGMPRRAGRFEVRISARDREASSVTDAFAWTIGAAPRVSQISLTVAGPEAPGLAFNVAAGRGAPPIRALRITVTGDLALVSRTVLRVTTTSRPARRLEFSHRVQRGAVSVTLHRPAAGFRVTLGPTPLIGDGSGLPNAAPLRRRRLNLSLIDANAGTSRLAATLPTARR